MASNSCNSGNTSRQVLELSVAKMLGNRGQSHFMAGNRAFQSGNSWYLCGDCEQKRTNCLIGRSNVFLSTGHHTSPPRNADKTQWTTVVLFIFAFSSAICICYF